MALPRYEAYQDSGIDWIGEIPSDWELLPIRAIFNERKERNIGPKTDFILSVTKDRGVIPYDEKGNIGNKKSENIENYKVVYWGVETEGTEDHFLLGRFDRLARFFVSSRAHHYFPLQPTKLDEMTSPGVSM